jgi:hypothetical protein
MLQHEGEADGLSWRERALRREEDFASTDITRASLSLFELDREHD